VNEYRVPSCGQKPSGRPGRSPFDRPTGFWQVLQKRFSSGTWGSVSRALAGSTRGTAGTSTSPAPRRLRAVVDARPEPRRDGRLPPVLPDQPLGPVNGAVDGPVDGPLDAAVDDGAAGSPAAASPHVSQYPPSIVPSQPGRPQGCGPLAGTDVSCDDGWDDAWDDGWAAGAAASPHVSQ
jgi:hypothetical protein